MYPSIRALTSQSGDGPVNQGMDLSIRGWTCQSGDGPVNQGMDLSIRECTNQSGNGPVNFFRFRFRIVYSTLFAK